jgi:hypothetical protein
LCLFTDGAPAQCVDRIVDLGAISAAYRDRCGCRLRDRSAHFDCLIANALDLMKRCLSEGTATLGG